MRRTGTKKVSILYNQVLCFFMKSPQYSIKWKLLAGFAGLTLLVLLVVLFTVSQILDNRIRENIHSNFREAGKIFEQLQDTRYRQLHQTAILVADIPYMKAAISTRDVNTINSQIREELVQLLHFDSFRSDTLSSRSLATAVDSVGLVMVFDPEGIPMGQLTNTELPDYSMTDRAGIQSALEGRSPRQSFIWKQEESYFNVITIPVFLQGQVIAALSLGYPIRNVETELLAQLIEYEVSYFAENRLLATSIESLSERGRKSLTEDIQNVLTDNQDMTEGETVELDFEGERWLFYILPMVNSEQNEASSAGYYTVVAQSLTKALEPLYALQRVIFLIGLGGILLAVVLGMTFTSSFTRPINLLLQGINRIENENYSEPVEVVSRDEFGQLTRTFNKLVSNIRENLKENEILMAEIHHRVKNNLAVISGLLEMEGSKADDIHTERILKNSQLRIHSMATVHEMLYQSQSFNKLSFDDFVSKIAYSIQEVYAVESSRIRLKLDVSEVQLNVNQAVPCGLIINELLTNAFKHAYPDERTGVIKVSLREHGDKIYIRVKDNGTGISDDLEKQESLGFTLIKILAKQIGAKINVNGENGTDIFLNFAKQNKKGSSSSLNL